MDYCSSVVRIYLCIRNASISAFLMLKVFEIIGKYIVYSHFPSHDDVIKWKHFPRYWSFCGNSPVTGELPSQRPVTRSFDLYLICAWTNGWVNNRQAGDLRRQRAYYYVIDMSTVFSIISRQHFPSFLDSISVIYRQHFHNFSTAFPSLIDSIFHNFSTAWSIISRQHFPSFLHNIFHHFSTLRWRG